eukprot:3462235-Prymnesium_polylepis.1
MKFGSLWVSVLGARRRTRGSASSGARSFGSFERFRSSCGRGPALTPSLAPEPPEPACALRK